MSSILPPGVLFAKEREDSSHQALGDMLCSKAIRRDKWAKNFFQKLDSASSDKKNEVHKFVEEHRDEILQIKISHAKLGNSNLMGEDLKELFKSVVLDNIT